MFSIDALSTIVLSAMIAASTAEPFLGSARESRMLGDVSRAAVKLRRRARVPLLCHAGRVTAWADAVGDLAVPGRPVEQ